jgi:hypothetical protein
MSYSTAPRTRVRRKGHQRTYRPRVELLEKRLQPQAAGGIPLSPEQARIQGDYGNLPLIFEANQGQTDAQVQFLARGSGYTAFFAHQELVVDLTSIGGGSSALRLQLAGSNLDPQIVGLDEQPGKINYFQGDDPALWQTNVPTFGRVEYQGVYPGIDLVYYGNQRQLEYDLDVAPGADPGRIALDVQGANQVTIDSQGELVLSTPSGTLVQHKPIIYQDLNGVRQDVAGSYVIRGGQVGIDVGSYDPTHPLVIDPVLSYSTYLGGSGTDIGYGIAVDNSGNAYVVGSTTSPNFPTTPGAYQGTFGGVSDVFVAKLNSTGTGLIYATYLGGSGDDEGYGIAVDSSGNAYVGGSASAGFPTTPGAFQRTFGGGAGDGFVAKLNPTGTALVYSTYLGGSFDDSVANIAIDSAGNAYVTGDSSSTDFPTTAGGFQRTLGGAGTAYQASDNAFFTKLNAAGSALLYSTYLGGSEDLNGDGLGGTDYGNAIAVDSAGNAYVVGDTNSRNFPTTANAFSRTLNLDSVGDPTIDTFVARFNPNASGAASLVYCTYLGGHGDDYSGDIAVDGNGNAYVVGSTDSTDFPLVNPFQASNLGLISNAYVARINTNASGTASLVYSTYLGGNSADSGNGIALDSAGNIYVTGDTTSGNFPTVNPIQATSGGRDDAFVAEFNPSGSALLFSTYLGGRGDDVGQTLAVDSSQDIFVIGQTTSNDFPTTPGAYQTTNRGLSNAFVTKIAPQSQQQATHFSAVPDTNPVTAGTSFLLTVTALDANNNVVPGYRGVVHFTATDSNPSLPGDYTFTASDSGVHTFGVTLRTSGSQTVTVRDTVTSSIMGSATVTVAPAAADHFLLTTSASTVQAGNPFDLTVTVQDAFNNTVTGYTRTVTFSTSDPTGGSLPGPYTFSTADAGTHTFSGGAALYTAGSQTISATDTAGITGTVPVTVTPAPAVQFQLNAPASVVSGQLFDITVIAQDPYGNTDPTYTGTVAFAATDPDPGVIVPSNYGFVAGDAGMHFFPGQTALITPGAWYLSVYDVNNNSIAGAATINVTSTDLALRAGSSREGQNATLWTQGLNLGNLASVAGPASVISESNDAFFDRSMIDNLFATAESETRRVEPFGPYQHLAATVSPWRDWLEASLLSGTWPICDTSTPVTA